MKSPVHHVLHTPTCSRGARGVAILLSPALHKAYQDAGSPKPSTFTPGSIEGGRFIGIPLKLIVKISTRKSFNKHKHKTLHLTLSSAYHPVEMEEQDDFNTFLKDMCALTPKSTILLSGQDMNASLGTSSKLGNCVERHGLSKRYTKGVKSRNLLTSFGLKAPSTFFHHKHYTTWTSFNNANQQFALDHWITNSMYLFLNTQTSHLGTHSNNSAVHITLKLHHTIARNKKPPKRIFWETIREEKNE